MNATSTQMSPLLTDVRTVDYIHETIQTLTVNEPWEYVLLFNLYDFITNIMGEMLFFSQRASV